MSEIHEAIEARDVERVKRLLQADPSVAEQADDLGNRPLHMASYAGQLEIVRMLLDSGVDVNALGDLGKTSLHYAAIEQEPQVAEVLLDYGADATLVDVEGLTPLRYAVGGIIDLSDSPVGQVLMRRGAPVDLESGVWVYDANELDQRLTSDPNAIEIYQRREQMVPQAAIRGNVALVNVLLRHGAPINGTKEARPLELALPYIEVLRRLLEAGADVTAKDASGETVLQYARRLRANKEVLDVLRQFGANE